MGAGPLPCMLPGAAHSSPTPPARRLASLPAGKWDGAPFANWRWRPSTHGALELIARAGRCGCRQSYAAAGLLFRKTCARGQGQGQGAYHVACSWAPPTGPLLDCINA